MRLVKSFIILSEYTEKSESDCTHMPKDTLSDVLALVFLMVKPIMLFNIFVRSVFQKDSYYLYDRKKSINIAIGNKDR